MGLVDPSKPCGLSYTLLADVPCRCTIAASAETGTVSLLSLSSLSLAHVSHSRRGRDWRLGGDIDDLILSWPFLGEGDSHVDQVVMN